MIKCKIHRINNTTIKIYFVGQPKSDVSIGFWIIVENKLCDQQTFMTLTKENFFPEDSVQEHDYKHNEAVKATTE